jgi:hypothetical protein
MKMVRYNPKTGEQVEFDDSTPTLVPTCACPCCRFVTLSKVGGYEICPVCFWEDDGQSDSDADEVRGGPNTDLSLTQARKNFIRIGACEESMVKNVRSPYPDELPK